jgi:tetratricopeptide (TPR) repeat protein
MKQAQQRADWSAWPLLAGLFLLALGVRLLVWKWREFYPLGGDESEYLAQAITLLQERRYVELRLMRPPLYTLFLALSIQLFDSLVQNLRLVQAWISAAMVVPIWLLTRAFGDLIGQPRTWRAPAIAGLLTALCYTFAANATELLSETLFLFGLTTLFWLLLQSAIALRDENRKPTIWIVLAGLGVGALCLLRSVAMPLIPLGLLWLALQRGLSLRSGWWRSMSVGAAALYLACALLVVLPWTARNYLTYNAFILIDTTGTENLWLDNNPEASTADDPLGREDAKRQLYEMGEDRALRQEVASQRGREAILNHPDWFIAKAGGELLKFFALEYSDDMRARPAIWLPNAEVWMRLLFGDALWLLILSGGLLGIFLLRAPKKVSSELRTGWRDRTERLLAHGREPWLLFAPWLIYAPFTAMLFHVELRYRLPIYPVLLLYSAWLLAQPKLLPWRTWRTIPAALLLVCCLGLTLAHAPYLSLGWNLANKHFQLAQAEAALKRGDAQSARTAAERALGHDPSSALAEVALARSALLVGDQQAATEALERAIRAKRAHPYAHLIKGDLLRAQAELEAARPELAYESASLEDLQSWLWERTITPVPSELDLGANLDLGFIEGFYLSETIDDMSVRWSHDRAIIRLQAPSDAPSLSLRIAGARPPGALSTQLDLEMAGEHLATIQVANTWQDYSVPLPQVKAGDLLEIELSSPAFRPRSFDPASPDGRDLGVLFDRVALESE